MPKQAFKRAIYLLPFRDGANPQELEHLRLRFIEISGTNTLFPRILSLRGTHSALSQFSDVYFSPLHMHWLIGTFSFMGEGTGPIPVSIEGCPVFLQETRAILPMNPDAPMDILSFFIDPNIPLSDEEVCEIRDLFPYCMSLTVKPWGHISIFFRRRESIDAAASMRGLPRRLGGLTYSFELKSYDQPPARRQPSLGSNIASLCGRVTGTMWFFLYIFFLHLFTVFRSGFWLAVLRACQFPLNNFLKSYHIPMSTPFVCSFPRGGRFAAVALPSLLATRSIMSAAPRARLYDATVDTAYRDN